MIRVRMLTLALALPIVLGTGIGSVEAAEVDAAGEKKDGWSPSLSIALEIFDHGGDGTVVSTVGQDNRNYARETISEFRIGLDLTSPEVPIWRARPRFFIQGGAQLGPEYLVTPAKIGSFSRVQPEIAVQSEIDCVPDPLCGPPPPPYAPASSFPNQGSQIDARYRGLGWYAGVGTSFAFPGALSILRFKPSAVYVGEKQRAVGALVSVTGTGPNYVVTRSIKQQEEDFHYLGPALGLDLALASTDNGELVLFSQVDLLWNVGDGSITFTDRGIVNYQYTTKDFRYMLGFGVRLVWKDAFGGS